MCFALSTVQFNAPRDAEGFDLVVLAFVAIPILLAAMLAGAEAFASRRLGESHAATRRALTVALAAAAWMTATWLIAARGFLTDWDAAPPRFAFVVVPMVVSAFTIAFGSVGRRLITGVPLWVLVAVQGFRLPLELAMHEMYVRGIMPEQMSYSGWNFDIVTGASALVVAALMRGGRAPRWLIAGWNVLGFVLLLNIISIAILSTPLVQAFGPDRLNVWVADPPFIWLPAVMVLAALAGHLLIFRALVRGSSSRQMALSR